MSYKEIIELSGWDSEHIEHALDILPERQARYPLAFRFLESFAKASRYGGLVVFFSDKKMTCVFYWHSDSILRKMEDALNDPESIPLLILDDDTCAEFLKHYLGEQDATDP